LNYVGTARPIHDAKGKATGYSKYAGDISLSNMAYLCMLHSKIPHGYVKAVHAEKALALPGVYGVYHCLNTSERKYNRYRSSFDQAYLANEERAFNQYVRFVGDKIGAVAACDQETAEKAARLVEVEYEELSFSIGFDDTLAGKNCLDGETPVRDEYELDVGEKQGSAEGLIEVCSTMELPRLHHDGDTRLHCRL
jgi:CO/xanthine dehydrogenase Mo-binding subunit